MKIEYNHQGATIDQQLYATSIANKLIKKGVDIFPRETPLPPDIILTKKDCPPNPNIQQETDTKYKNIHFRLVIGALIYLSSGTRPDITFATVKLAKYAHSPGDYYYKALIWLVGYIHKFPNKAIHFYSDIQSSPIRKVLHQSNISLNDKLTVTFTNAS